MKYLIILLLTLFSCDSKSKTADKKPLETTEIEIKSVENLVEKSTEPLSVIELIDIVTKMLNLSKEQYKLELIGLKQNPNNPDETYMAIPEIVKEDDEYIEFNSHILIVDSNTGEIKQKYFESSQTNGWISDELALKEIKIDTAPYIVSKNQRAFGVRTFFAKFSKEYPFSSEQISLFTKTDTSIKKVLNNYRMMTYAGEWSGKCFVEFTLENKTLMMTKEESNGYFNILVKNKIKDAVNYYDEENECKTKETVNIENTVLKFDGKTYK